MWWVSVRPFLYTWKPIPLAWLLSLSNSSVPRERHLKQYCLVGNSNHTGYFHVCLKFILSFLATWGNFVWELHEVYLAISNVCWPYHRHWAFLVVSRVPWSWFLPMKFDPEPVQVRNASKRSENIEWFVFLTKITSLYQLSTVLAMPLVTVFLPLCCSNVRS